MVGFGGVGERDNHINEKRAPRLTTERDVCIMIISDALGLVHMRVELCRFVAHFDTLCTLDNVSIVFLSLIVFCGNKLNVVSIYDSFLKRSSEVGVDGVYDVTVCAVGIFSRGHYDKVTVSRVDDLYVMNCKTIVKCYRYNSLHRAFVKEFSDFDVCDLHLFFLSSKCIVCTGSESMKEWCQLLGFYGDDV